MNARARLLLLVVVALGCSLVSAPSVAADGHMDFVDKFFQILKEQKSATAIDYVFSSSPWAEEQKAQFAQVKAQYVAVEPLLGELLDYDVLIDQTIKGRYAYVLIMAVYDRQPVKIEFILYKPRDKWRLQNFLFNTDISDDIRNVAMTDALLREESP